MYLVVRRSNVDDGLERRSWGAQQQLNLGGRSFGQWIVGSATRRHAGIMPGPVNAVGLVCLPY